MLVICGLAALMFHCAGPEHTTTGELAQTQQDGATPTYRSLDEEPAADERLRPANHDVDWLMRHATVARADSQDCMTCHVEQDCASCHTEELSPPFSVHPPNFVVMHSVDARLDQDNCTDCHKPETFCASCHIQTRVSAIDGGEPPARMQFHPPGWLDNSAPDNHGVAARRNITECATCHQEQDCVTCHTGINPHPPEFRLNCGSWLKADPRPCTTCHQDVGMLRRLCL
jgi:hypothetical protein